MDATAPRCHFLSKARLSVTNLNSPPPLFPLTVSRYLSLSLSISHCLSPSLCLSLSFHAVAREAGRMRSLAAAEGHRKKTGIGRKCEALVELVWSPRSLDPIPYSFQCSNSRINECKARYLGSFSPLPYMAGQRYIVPVFNRLAAAALLGGSVLTLVLLNYFWSKSKRRLFWLLGLFSCAINVADTNESGRFGDSHACKSQSTRIKRYFTHGRALF